jgi:hypothetical protein
MFKNSQPSGQFFDKSNTPVTALLTAYCHSHSDVPVFQRSVFAEFGVPFMLLIDSAWVLLIFIPFN